MRRTNKEEMLMADCGRLIALHSLRLSMGSRGSLLLGCGWKAATPAHVFANTQGEREEKKEGGHREGHN